MAHDSDYLSIASQRKLGKYNHSLSNAFTASSAVTCALAGFAPVTMRPSVYANAAQGPGGGTSTAKLFSRNHMI